MEVGRWWRPWRSAWVGAGLREVAQRTVWEVGPGGEFSAAPPPAWRAAETPGAQGWGLSAAEPRNPGGQSAGGAPGSWCLEPVAVRGTEAWEATEGWWPAGPRTRSSGVWVWPPLCHQPARHLKARRRPGSPTPLRPGLPEEEGVPSTLGRCRGIRGASLRRPQASGSSVAQTSLGRTPCSARKWQIRLLRCPEETPGPSRGRRPTRRVSRGVS